MSLVNNFLISTHQFAAGAITNCSNPNSCDTTLPSGIVANDNFLKTGLQLTFGVLGALAVIYIIIGGLKYVSSQGDPSEVSKAKNTIIYAVIGLVVAVLAEAIVGFVLGLL